MFSQIVGVHFGAFYFCQALPKPKPNYSWAVLVLNPASPTVHGVGTIVQGAIVQGDSCPRRLLSKETFVQGDFCPRRLLSKEDYCPRRHLSKETIVKVDNCPRTILDKSLLGQMSPWTIVSLGNSLLGQSPLGQLSQHQK